MRLRGYVKLGWEWWPMGDGVSDWTFDLLLVGILMFSSPYKIISPIGSSRVRGRINVHQVSRLSGFPGSIAFRQTETASDSSFKLIHVRVAEAWKGRRQGVSMCNACNRR